MGKWLEIRLPQVYLKNYYGTETILVPSTISHLSAQSDKFVL